MQIEAIRLRDFRNYHSLILTPHPGVNILLGQNGSGKTNLLEAVHYCALGRSHRTGLDREVVRKGAMMAASGVTLRKKSGKTEIAVKLTPSEARKKTVFIDCKRAERISALMGHVQCVIFSPEDLMLVKEGPAIRRRMLDMMLSQLSTAYFSALQQYQKALEQRTALLREAKRGKFPDCSAPFIWSKSGIQPVPSCVVTLQPVSARSESPFTFEYLPPFLTTIQLFL